MVLHFFKSSYTKVKSALSRARSFFGEKIKSLFQGKIDEAALEKLEQFLYEVDFGVQTSKELTNKIRQLQKENPSLKPDDYYSALRSHLVSLLSRYPSALVQIPEEKLPLVILIVGVNGNGKITFVAKLSYLLKQGNQKVLVAAADTFRAAAIEQLETWAHRLNIDIVKGAPQSDPRPLPLMPSKPPRQENVMLSLSIRQDASIPKHSHAGTGKIRKIPAVKPLQAGLMKFFSF